MNTRVKQVLCSAMTGCLLLLLSACQSGAGVLSSSAPGEAGRSESPQPQVSSSEEASQSLPSAGEPDQPQKPQEEGSSSRLVVYFSCTGATERIAQWIAQKAGADLYEIIPQTPYTQADLDYTDPSSRTSLESADPSARPAIQGDIEHIEQYDVIFLGYPIWNGEAPRILSTFVEGHELSGKTLVPFCTSGGSGFADSDSALQSAAADALWLEGERFSSSATQQEVEAWLSGLPLDDSAQPAQTDPAQITVQDEAGHTVTFALHENAAAEGLLAQLPLVLPVEDFSTNEKIAYLPKPLDTAGASLSAGNVGELAYYSPWGNIAMFYGDYAPSEAAADQALYALGTAVSGGEQIEDLSGAVTLQLCE